MEEWIGLWFCSVPAQGVRDTGTGEQGAPDPDLVGEATSHGCSAANGKEAVIFRRAGVVHFGLNAHPLGQTNFVGSGFGDSYPDLC